MAKKATARKFDPYEELGVDRKADQATIKRAYRARARKTHPDAGGNVDDFDKAKRAQIILLDPDKRQKFDNTGDADLNEPDNIDTAAMNMVIDFIRQAIEIEQAPHKVDLVGKMKQLFPLAVSQAAKDIRDLEAKIHKAEKMLGRFRRKSADEGTENVIERMLQAHIRDLGAPLAGKRETLRIRERALEIINEYEFDWERTPSTSPFSDQPMLKLTRIDLLLGATGA